MACYGIDNHNRGLSRNGSPTLSISSFGTLPYLDPEGIQPRTDGTGKVYALFYLHICKI